jgi:Apolipoprotein N-acyltransferase
MDCVWIIFSGAIGWFALSSSPRFPVLLLTVPILWALASTRFAAFGVWFAFKLTVSRGLIPGAAVFLPETHTPAQAVLLWLLMSLGVSLPFGIFWSEKPRKKAALLVAAFIVAYVLPPVSLIGIVNPLIAVGCILPGWGWRGLFVGIAIFCICASWRKAATAILAIVLVLPLFNLASLKPSPAPHDFLAVNTSFGRLGSGSFKFQDDYDRAKMVFDHLRQIRIHEAREKYIVLPETIAGRLNESGLRLWRDEMSKVLREDQIVFFGAEIPTDDSAKYDNAVVFWGNGKAGVIRQRIPVPYSMYRGPFSDNGASLHFFDNGISELPDGRRIVAVICYEAFLTWPYLVPFLCESKSIICVSNLWWCHDTSLPIIQTTYLKAWGQLFGISVVFACNI